MEQNQILGINTKPDLTFRLLVELSRWEEEYEPQWIGNTCQNGVIQQISSSEQPLSTWLPEHPNSLAILSLRAGTKSEIQFCQFDKLALVYVGTLDNPSLIRYDLLELGYELDGKTDQELIYLLLNRYLEIGISPIEAMRLVFVRMNGRFAAISLFAQPKEMLLAASRGYPLAFGAASDNLIVGSDIQMLKRLSPSVMALGEGNPIVLYSA